MNDFKIGEKVIGISGFGNVRTEGVITEITNSYIKITEEGFWGDSEWFRKENVQRIITPNLNKQV
jgi:hypothetical protein